MTEHHGYPVPLDDHRRSDGLGHVYVAQFGNDDIKIGHTTSPGRRFRNLDGGLNRVARTWHFRSITALNDAGLPELARVVARMARRGQR